MPNLICSHRTVKRFILNAGQVCSAGTRVIVQRSVYETFNAKLTNF